MEQVIDEFYDLQPIYCAYHSQQNFMVLMAAAA